MDRQAYGQAYERGFASTTHFLMSCGLTRQEAEESAQAAWTRGWERRSDLRDSSSVQSWVNAIALNLFRNALRVERRSECLPSDLLAKSAELAAVIDGRRLVETCRPKDRGLMWAYYAEGYSSEELAKKLGVTPSAIRVRLLRARRAIRGVLRPSGSVSATNSAPARPVKRQRSLPQPRMAGRGRGGAQRRSSRPSAKLGIPQRFRGSGGRAKALWA